MADSHKGGKMNRLQFVDLELTCIGSQFVGQVKDRSIFFADVTPSVSSV